MKRLLVLLTIVAAALLLVPAAAFAFGAPRAVPLTGPVRASAGGAARAAAAVKVGSARLSPSFVLSGTGVIKLNLYDSWSTPQAGASVSWYVWGDTDFGTGDGTIDVNGHVELGGVPAAEDNGEIVIFSPNPYHYVYDLYDMSWPAEGTDMGVQPGRQAVKITAGGGWAKYWTDAWVDLYSDDGSTLKYSETRVTRTGTTTYGAGDALSGTITDGAVYFLMNEGRELDTTGLTASPGQDTARTLNCPQYGSPRLYTSNTSWDSGKPGSAVKFYFKYFPAGWINDLSGYDYDTGRPSLWHSAWKSPGKSAYSKTLTVPSGAKPGHIYMFEAQHRTGPLYLQYSYQVCTLNASDTTVRAGQTIRLSGVVPVNPGHAKKVYIWKRSTAAGQPQYYGNYSSLPGWTRVAAVYTDGKGYYSKSVTPGRTTYYCVYYPEDKAGHWPAWTSVRKVTKS